MSIIPGQTKSELKVNQDIKESELIYDILCRGIPIGVFRATTESVSRLISVNQTLCEMYGCNDSEEMINAPFSSLFADIVDLDSFSITVQATGRIRDFVCRQKSRDGSVFLAWISANLVTDREGFSFYDGIISNLQERRRLTSVFEGSKKEWEIIFDSLTELTLVSDNEGRIIRCNRAAVARLDMPFQRIIGQPISALFFGGDIPEVDPFLPGVREVHIERISGDFLIVNTTFSSAMIPQGTVHVMTDITEHKKAEETIREKESIYRTLAERTYAGVYVVQDRNFRFINDNAASYAGYTREELLGRDTGILIHPEDREEMRRQSKKMLTGEKMTPYEFRILTKNGDTRWIMETVTPITYEGKPAILGNSMDITERRQREIHDQHEDKLESVGQLAAGIAHEINTPIQFIGDNIHFLSEAFQELFSLLPMYLELKNRCSELPSDCSILRDRILDKIDVIDMEYLHDEVPRAIKQSLDGIQRVSTIVKAMREFSHPGGEQKETFNLNEAIKSAITLTRNEWKYSADLKMSLSPDLPPVKGYPADFNQVILNLIINAAHAIQAKLKTNPEEKGLIEIKTCRDGDEAEICIRDTGTGIPSDIHSKIFNPFFTTKEIGKGTGQGLAIAQNIIVRKHGGRLYFESTLGKGTTFHIRLPLDNAE